MMQNAIPVCSRACAKHPSQATRSCSVECRTTTSSRAALPFALLARLAAHLDSDWEGASHRLLQPTSHYEHPTNRLDSRARSFRCNDRLRREPRSFHLKAFGTAASDHLSAIRPRVGTRLTALLQLRPISSTFPFPCWEEMTSCVTCTQVPLPRRFQPWQGWMNRPLTLLSRPVSP